MAVKCCVCLGWWPVSSPSSVSVMQGVSSGHAQIVITKARGAWSCRRAADMLRTHPKSLPAMFAWTIIVFRQQERPAAHNVETRPWEEYCPLSGVLHSKTLVASSLYLTSSQVRLFLPFSGRQWSISSACLSPFRFWWPDDNIRRNLKFEFLQQNVNCEEARWHSGCYCISAFFCLSLFLCLVEFFAAAIQGEGNYLLRFRIFLQSKENAWSNQGIFLGWGGWLLFASWHLVKGC